MAKLTGDEVILIQTNGNFVERVLAVIKVKAQQFSTMGTPARADVNRRMQKRKRLAKNIMNTSWADTAKQQVAQFWLAWYAWNVDPAVLDGDGLPSYDTIFNSFDATWDNFSGVLAGDDTDTEIEW